MQYNFISYDSKVEACSLCKYDSNVGYETDFSNNGDVNYWTHFDGLHTYGCWNNFLFGTLYGDQAMVSRHFNIPPIDGEMYYLVSISMLIKLVDRGLVKAVPTRAKFMWVTIENNQWSEDKSLYFDIKADSNWHTYVLNLATKQRWVGNISNLKLYPVYENGRDGDELFIKSIQIRAKDTFVCEELGCSYYSRYEHPCGGVGARAYCESSVVLEPKVSIIHDYNDLLILNINGYGEEYIRIDSLDNIKQSVLAKKLTQAIGSINIGGYAEAEIVFTEKNRFIIYNGVYLANSTISIICTQLAKDMGFFKSNGDPIYTFMEGRTPASLYRPNSSFRATPSQLVDLLDNSISSYIEFDPSLYSIEGGRNDWYLSGLGYSQTRVDANDTSSIVRREFSTIDGIGKTLIDFSHPFNASGRITKVYVCGTVDYGYEQIVGLDGGIYSNGEWGLGRLYSRGAKVKVFRPRNDGTLESVAEVIIPDREPPTSTLTSIRQEYTEADCDIFVNKGDLIGVYNISLYYGKSISVYEIDASYYKLEGDFLVGSQFTPGELNGSGNAGLLIYARSDQKQNRLHLNIDLNNRINVGDIKIKGSVYDEDIEYNIMRCLDFVWQVDLFGRTHTTSFKHLLDSARVYTYTIVNTCYGVNRLNDGIYIVPDGKAADSFYMQGPNIGVVPVNPYYFFVNGDHEWLDVHYWPEYWRGLTLVENFTEDPIAFTIIFPYNKYKNIHKFKTHFKETYNFRSFALSTYAGPLYKSGDADDPRFVLIPEYTAVTLDGLKYSKDSANYESSEKYLFVNPSIGHPIIKITGGPGWEFPGDAVIPGEGTFSMNGVVLNNEQIEQAKNLDWKILQHEWEPISCYGFRFYCNYHESTKICEMELFGYLSGGIAQIAAGTNVLTSFYGDSWLNEEIYEDSEKNAACSPNNSIRYVDVEINPINAVILTDLSISVTGGDLFFGDKGCEGDFFIKENLLAVTNPSQAISIKNTYVDNTSLFVDIAKGAFAEKKVLYYSSLSNRESIYSPEIGPAAFYTKEKDFLFLNQDRNVAINCKSYGLSNSIIGAVVYYSYNNGYSWLPFNNGSPIASPYIDFNNLPNTTYSIINIPVLHKSKYWRIALKGSNNILSIREIFVFRGSDLLNVKTYHDRDANVNYTSATRRAPHLLNMSTTGSYYKIKNDEFITIELEDENYIDKILIFHDSATQWVHYYSINKFCGVDRYTRLYLETTNDTIYDYSYYEHSGLYNNNVAISKSEYEVNYYKEYDFANNTESYFEWRSYGFSVDYIVPSGTIDLGVYEFSGYLSLYKNMYSVGPGDVLLFANMPISKDIFYYTHGLKNPSFEIKIIMSLSTSEPLDYRYGISCGFLSGDHRPGGYGSYRFGPQFMAHPNGFGIVVQQWNGTQDTIFQNCTTLSDAVLYYVFSSDGLGNYSLSVYSDTFGGTRICDITLYSNKQWESLYFGITSSIYTGNYILYSKIYYLSIRGYLLQKNLLNSPVFGSMEFNSSLDSYLTVPYSDVFNFGAKKFSIEFFLKINEFPYGICNIAASEFDMYPVNISFNEGGRHGWRGTFNTGSYIYMYSTEELNLSDKNFTIDFLVKFSNLVTNPIFFTKSGAYSFYYDVINMLLKFDGYQGGSISSNVSASAHFEVEYAKYYHITISRSLESMIFFIDGEVVGTTIGIVGAIDFPTALPSSTDTNIYIGTGFVGYMEEFRITLGIARWSESFSVPQVAYLPDIYTFLLGRFGRGYATIIENYNREPLAASQQKAWSVRLVQYKTQFAIQFTYNSTVKIFDVLVNNQTGYAKLKRHLWHHIVVSAGFYDNDSNRTLDININGKCRSNIEEVLLRTTSIAAGNNDLLIGKYLNGNLKHIRISSTDSSLSSDYLGARVYYNASSNYPIPLDGHARLYAVSMYTSSNNLFYGLHSDIDLYKESIFSYFDNNNVYAANYCSLFAVDLANRFDLNLIRSYGSSSYTAFDLNQNIIYSNVNSTDPSNILSFYEGTLDRFEQEDYSTSLYNWLISCTAGSSVYIKDFLLIFKANGDGLADASAKISSKYIIKESFSFVFSYGIILSSYYSWSLSITFTNFNDSSQEVVLERCRKNNIDKYMLSIKDMWHASLTTVNEILTFDTHQDIKVTRFGSFFYFYKKNNDELQWSLMFYFSITADYWEYTKISFELSSLSPIFPNVELYLSSIDVEAGRAYYSNNKDARWVIINVLNGDGISRHINRVGIYTNIQSDLAPDGHGKNNKWVALYDSITSYGADINVAYKALVYVSSYMPFMSYNNLVDGNKESYWGSGHGDPQPIITVDLGELYNVYRVRLHFGLTSENLDYLVKNYTVSYSVDGSVYTLFKTITGNILTERNHDANPYIAARYVKLSITSYSMKSVSIYDPETKIYKDFTGAIVREIEVFKYTGAVLSSEEYPIIAFNLRKHFYLNTDHGVIGTDYENKEVVDWDTSTSSFCYSNYFYDDINKVIFKEWGAIPNYEKWVVIKKDSATNYNEGPHYIKNIKIRSIYKEDPIETATWWLSDYSILSNSYDFLQMSRVLKITYPSGTSTDEVRFIEGDSFGIDLYCSWRDLFSFSLYINDINRLDTDYGTFYLGGYDSTEKHNPVVYIWNISSIKDKLVSGLNIINLGFRYCDDLIYSTSQEFSSVSYDTRDVKKIVFGTVGMTFRGTGLGGLVMAVEKLHIKRNHFDDIVVESAGLYLTGRDYLFLPLSAIKMSCCSISFWLKTDFNLDGIDEYGVFAVRNIFSLINNSNDTFGLYVGMGGFTFYGGNVNSGTFTYSVGATAYSFKKEQVCHVGISFSGSGEHLDSDGSTIRLYINNVLQARVFNKWNPADSKYFKLILGGRSVGAVNQQSPQRFSSLDAVISDLKICNYCKTDFSKDMGSGSESQIILYNSSDFIEISKDNVTFYKVGAVELPLEFNEVSYMDERVIYIRSNFENKILTGTEDRVAGLVVQWDIPIG